MGELLEKLSGSGWRIANTVPVNKKSCQEKPEDWRPLGLTSMEETLVERILRDKIYMDLERQAQS